jgi:hypothetical protein
MNPTARRGAKQAHILCGESPVVTGEYDTMNESRVRGSQYYDRGHVKSESTSIKYKPSKGPVLPAR